ncbi:MAG TPA: hypothetical protein VFV34_26810 [Blastocatellia bacterium]|nr:hypothetical protein [Blastocatellia bacterium]
MAKKRTKKGEPTAPTDLNALIQAVLRESYIETSKDLQMYADKVKHYNDLKKRVRAYLEALREFHCAVLSDARERGIPLTGGGKNDESALSRLLDGHAHSYKVDEVAYEVSIPDRVPPKGVDGLDQLANQTAKWEEKLNSIGDDAQLANIDLQNILQKQQQTLQTMSNISSCCTIRQWR